ncbi:MAG: hypothetical protein RJA07_2590 [Bacteroidota bacterium]
MLCRLFFCILFLLFKYSTATSQVAYSFGADSNDVVSNILLDKFGNVYMAANFCNTITIDKNSFKKITSTNHSQDILLAKFNSFGKLIWANKIGGMGKDEIHDMKIDANGYLYLVGYFSKDCVFENAEKKINLSSNGATDGFIVKILSTTGNIDWVNQLGGEGADDICSVTIDKADGVVVSGRFSKMMDADISEQKHLLISKIIEKKYSTAFIARYNAYDGKYIYANTMGIENDNPSFQSQSCVVSDEKNNCFFISTFTNSVDINPNGNALNISSNGKNDLVLIKYDVNGKLLESIVLGGEGNENCNNKCLAINKKNELIFAISFQNECLITNPYLTSKVLAIAETDLLFAKTNNKLSEIFFAKPICDNGMMNCNQIIVDDENNISIVGYTKKRTVNSSNKMNKQSIKPTLSANLYNSYFYVLANNAGDVLLKKFNTNTSENCSIHSIQSNLFSKDIWLAGNFNNTFAWQNATFKSNGKKDFFLVKLKSDLTVWKLLKDDTTNRLTDENFVVDVKSNQQSTLLNTKYMVNNSSPINLTLYDYKGNKIKQMLNDKQPLGLQQIFFDISFLPAGLYFLKLNGKMKYCMKN